MAGEDESLLDTFVTISTKGLEESEKAIDEFIARVKGAFGSVAAVNIGEKIGASIKSGLKKEAASVKAEAAKIADGLREALLKFGIDKDLLSIDIRLLGDEDIKRRLADLQSRVSAATKDFKLAEPGEAGNSARAAAVDQINQLRENELRILKEITQQQVQQAGLSSVYEKQAEAFLKSSQSAQNFNQELKETARLVSAASSKTLSEEFAKLSQLAERFNLALRQGIASGDLVATENAVAELNTLRQQFDRFRDDAGRKIVINTDAEKAINDFKRLATSIQQDDAFAAKTNRGSLTGDQKVRVEELKLEIQRLTSEMRLLGQATDLSADEVVRLGTLLNSLRSAGQGLESIRAEAKAAGPQMNSLSNNAYQLGQAFEDAAIGFQLNGLSGAFRGASNNITFLIQNLAQSGALTETLGEKAAKLIPLYAGVGAAIGFVVLPPLIEWLQTLDDIDTKSKNIADLIRSEFADARFEVSLEIDQQSAIKAVQDAEDAAEAIRLVIEQAQQSEKLTLQLSAELNNLARRQVVDDLGVVFDDLQNVIDRRIKQIARPGFGFGGEFGENPILPDETEFNGVNNLNSALSVLQTSLKQAFEQSKKGIVDDGSLESARDSIKFITENMQELVDSGLLSADAATAMTESLSAARGELEKITEQSQRIVSINENLNRLLDEAREKGEQLSAEYEFQQAVNEGRLSDNDKFLFGLQQQTQEIEKQNEKLKEQFGDNPIAQRIIDQEELNLLQRQEIDITKEIRDVNEEIADKKEQAEKDAKAALKEQAEIAKRLQKEQERGNERVANAQASLNEEIEDQARSRQEKLIQDRIDALQKADRTSQTSALGSERAFAFADDVKPEVDRLQDLLKQERELQQTESDRERLRELEARIVDERAAFAERIADLRADAEEARQKEVDALHEAAKEMEKLRDQLNQLNQGLNAIQGGNPVGIPEFDEEGNRLGPMFAPEVGPDEMANAQAQANAAAIQNIDFKSSSLETLTAQSNRLLSTLNESILTLDLQARLV